VKNQKQKQKKQNENLIKIKSQHEIIKKDKQLKFKDIDEQQHD